MPRKSIYLPDEIMPIIGASDSGGFSQRLVGIIKDWQAIIADAMPTLKEAEWLYLMDMLNGVVLEGRHADFLKDEVLDSAPVLADKWKIDPRALAKKVDALPLAGKIAIQDVAYRFWQPHGIVTEYREVLEKCGANIAK
jgi:hypothetical protein